MGSEPPKSFCAKRLTGEEDRAGIPPREDRPRWGGSGEWARKSRHVAIECWASERWMMMGPTPRGIVSLCRSLHVGVVLALLAAADLHAQTPASDRGYVSGRVGATIQAAEDAESGTSVGAGASAGVFTGSRWAVEFEAWIPTYIEANGKRFRDLLFSGSVVRFFNARRRGPFLLAGFTAARVQSKTPFGEFSNGYGYVQVGGGLFLPLGPRLALAPEVRANLGLTSNIVRPMLGLVYSFR